MQNFNELPPISLYIHIPWCVRKCPYCDFNSHAMKDNLPEALYVQALLDEFHHQRHWLQNRPITSIFFGGGTPSLFSGQAIGQILNSIAKVVSLPDEITLEANPGTIDESRFQDFRAAGVNRLSLGVQSMNDEKLKALGRIHDKQQVITAIQAAKKAGFDNFNLDIMHGLPNQTLQEAMQDIKLALAFEPTHFSWYQLTLEPNTLFYRSPPVLPEEDVLWEIQQAGQQLISEAGFKQYEVSAYAQPDKQCRHNQNYWAFGDYLGIGAGAHSKITDLATQQIKRFAQVKHPKDYLLAEKRLNVQVNTISAQDTIFEFMLNALRLTAGVPVTLFSARTGLSLDNITPILKQAQSAGLLMTNQQQICATALGQRYLNDVVSLFLVSD